MIGKTKEGWSIIANDHSQWSHSDLIRLHKRIDIDLAGMRSQDFIRPYLKPGTAVIDIGAHLGVFTIPMMRAVGRDGLVLAFEPDPELFICLSRNTDKESDDNPETGPVVCPYPWAISEHTGTQHFFRNPENRGAGHLNFGTSRGTGLAVNVATLDELQPLLGNRPLSFIKIDCEGSEIDVIRGGAETLTRHRPVLFIELSAFALIDRGVTKDELEEEIRAFGYRIQYFPEHWVKAGMAPHDILATPL